MSNSSHLLTKDNFHNSQPMEAYLNKDKLAYSRPKEDISYLKIKTPVCSQVSAASTVTDNEMQVM